MREYHNLPTTRWKLKKQILYHKKKAIYMLIGAVLGLIFLFQFIILPINTLLSKSRELESVIASFSQINGENLGDIDPDEIKNVFSNTEYSLEKMSNAYNNLGWAGNLFFFSKNYNAGRDLISEGKDIVHSFSVAMDKLEPVINMLSTNANGDFEFSAPEAEEGKSVFKVLFDAIKIADEAIFTLNLDLIGANVELSRIASLDIQSKISSIASEFQAKTRDLQNKVESSREYFDLARRILSDGKKTTYLLLFQNNIELRPTGGFWGNYGVVSIENGEISDVFIEDIYKIDNDDDANSFGYQSPYPLPQYFLLDTLHFRDLGWWPDIPTTSELALDYFEHIEGYRPHGVIYVDPIVIEDILRASGPLELEGFDEPLTHLNSTSVIQQQTTFDFTDFENRKAIVGEIGNLVINEVLSSKGEELRLLIEGFQQNLDEKHIQVYSTDPVIENFLCEQQWCGAVAETNEDYFMAVEGNIGINKANYFVNKSTTYSISENTDGTLDAEVEIIYENPFRNIWPAKVYTNYLRIYAPVGSKMLSTKGFIDTPTTTVEMEGTSKEKTIFGGVTRVYLESKTIVRVKYRLPFTRDDLGESYDLLVQKQAGVPTLPGKPELRGNPFVIKIDFEDFQKNLNTTLTQDITYQFPL